MTTSDDAHTTITTTTAVTLSIVREWQVASRGPGSGAVVAFLLWVQEVGGSNPPSPTLDDEPCCGKVRP